jgi:hypothetical protein
MQRTVAWWRTRARSVRKDGAVRAQGPREADSVKRSCSWCAAQVSLQAHANLCSARKCINAREVEVLQARFVHIPDQAPEVEPSPAWAHRAAARPSPTTGVTPYKPCLGLRLNVTTMLRIPGRPPAFARQIVLPRSARSPATTRSSRKPACRRAVAIPNSPRCAQRVDRRRALLQELPVCYLDAIVPAPGRAQTAIQHQSVTPRVSRSPTVSC